jgi:hypothetical protein
MDIKLKPRQTSKRLENMCKISGLYDKHPPFHKSSKFMTLQKSKHDQSASKISNKLEIHSKIPKIFMISPNIQKKHHAKNLINWHLIGMANKIIKLSKQWCDTHCHTYIKQIISQQPEMRKMQTLYQNVH